MSSGCCMRTNHPNARKAEGNFRPIAVLPVFVSRLLVILTLLAAALPAAAGAQTPVPQAPVAVTGAADSITETSANLNGTVDPNGGTTTYHFEYGTSAAYGLTTPENTAPGPKAPTANSTTSRDVTSRTARLLTRANPNGQATSVRFEYGRTTNYGSFTDRVDVGAGTRSVPVSIGLEGLQPNTRYHFRAVATNETGSTRSLDRSFRTLREPTGVSLALNPSRVVWGGALTVVGRINGTAVGGIQVVLERQAFPFQSAFTEVATNTASGRGTFSFNVGALFETTHFRAVTLSRNPVASGVITASSAVKVGVRARSRGRRRARIEGAIWPRVPTGRVSLQKRSPRGRWADVKRAAPQELDADRSRYRFTVRKGKRKRPAARYRVVVLARDGGAHVPGRSRVVRVASVKRR